MRGEFIEVLAKRKGIELAYQKIAEKGIPIDYRDVSKLREEVYKSIEMSDYTSIEKKYMLEGAGLYFLECRLILRDAFVDVV